MVRNQQQPDGSIRLLPRCVHFTIQHRPKNANADARSRLPFLAIAEDPQSRYRQTDLSDLDIYFVGASGIHPSSLQTSSDSSLGGLADALGRLVTALGGPTATPDDVVFVRGGGRSAFLKTAQGLELFRNMLEQGDICQRGGAFWQSGAARCSRARSCSVAIRDGRCDNDDATFDSFPLICIGGCISVIGESEVAACRCRSVALCDEILGQ